MSAKVFIFIYFIFFVMFSQQYYQQYQVVSNRLLSDCTRINGADYEECWKHFARLNLLTLVNALVIVKSLV